MHEKIRDIQNSTLKAYISFYKTKDMIQYNTDAKKLVEKYKNDGIMLNFCQNLLFAWAPVINEMMEVSNGK